jgi:hypothetical protein
MSYFFYYYLFIKSSACSITVSNTTCYRCLPFLLIVIIYIWFIFSKSIELIYLSNCFKYLFVSLLLLNAHLPTFNTLLFRCVLSFTNLSHLNIRWSTVCVPCLHGHSGHAIIFNRCKYDRIFPWPVIITVIFGLRFKFSASLPSTLGKNSLTIYYNLMRPPSYTRSVADRNIVTRIMTVYMLFQLSAATYMRSSLFYVVTQRWLVGSRRLLGATYRSHLQGPKQAKKVQTVWPLKAGQ